MPASTTDVNKHLETLGLKPEDLNEDAIRVTYKKLALRWHPDRHNADPEEAKEKFIEVNDAYKALVEECKKRNKGRKPRKVDDSSSMPRPFWASSTPSASSASSTPSAASTSSASCTTESTAKPTENTEIPSAKPTDSLPAKPASETRSAKSSSRSPHSSSTSSKPKHGDNHSAIHSHRDKHDAHSDHPKSRRSGDRDSSHSSPRPERSHPKPSSTSSTAHKSPRPFQTSYLHSDTDSETSSEGSSLHKYKSRHQHRDRTKGKKHSLGEDDYEFIDLGTPLKPLRSPKPLSSTSKDWIFPLNLPLEDLYFGATHRYRITRTLCSLRPSDPSHKSHPSATKTQTVQIDIVVAPGWRTGTRIRVPGVGNQRTDGSFQDIVFVVEEIPHPRFTRKGDDLILPVRVPWADAHSRPYPPSDLYGDDDSILGDGSGSGGRYKFGFGRWRHGGRGHGHEREEVDDEVYVMGMDGEEYTLPIPRTLVEAADGTRVFGAGMPIRKNGVVIGKGDLVIR
ncbi:hypothetical protein C8Q74DRAFT_609479 [Fomes fomentarius]|nr:hypothetical protein C8Q74DRAFT_609479 [Fomes fomentarius]